MTNQILCFLMLLGVFISLDLRNHTQANRNSSYTDVTCHPVQKQMISYNRNCQFKYSSCQQNTQQILSIIDCTYCEGYPNCPYLKYLTQVQCIEKCCPFNEYFLASMSSQRLTNCLMFTVMQEETKTWIHNDFFFPFLIVLIVLLIITLVILLVKTAIHLWGLYINKNKPDQEQINDETTQQNQQIPGWAFQN